MSVADISEITLKTGVYLWSLARVHSAPLPLGKTVVWGEAAGLQIQLGPSAIPGRFDS